MVGVAPAQVEREAQHLELAERVDVRAVARHDLAEHVLGNERRAAHVVDAQLHVGALVVGVVQAGDDMGHAVQAAAHFGHHEVRVVELGDGRDDVAVLHAGLHERLLVETEALHRRAVEVAPQVRERVGVLVDDAHVVAVVRQHVRQLRTHAAAADDDHVAHTDPFTKRPCADFLPCPSILQAPRAGKRRNPPVEQLQASWHHGFRGGKQFRRPGGRRNV